MNNRGGLSCYLNSVVIGKTTLTGVNENTGFVSIYDRQNDCKYYAYAYTGGTIAVNDGDYIEVECNKKKSG